MLKYDINSDLNITNIELGVIYMLYKADRLVENYFDLKHHF